MDSFVDIEMIVPGGPGGKSLLVLYKCPHCCTGSAQVQWQITDPVTRNSFMNGAIGGNHIRTTCAHCDRTIVLKITPGLQNMLRAFKRTL